MTSMYCQVPKAASTSWISLILSDREFSEVNHKIGQQHLYLRFDHLETGYCIFADLLAGNWCLHSIMSRRCCRSKTPSSLLWQVFTIEILYVLLTFSPSPVWACSLSLQRQILCTKGHQVYRGATTQTSTPLQGWGEQGRKVQTALWQEDHCSVPVC